jgi:acyl carrier protein
MVPSHYVVLDALPLTSGGKVDRRALPDPGALPAALPGSFEPPRTPAEERVAEIWCEILGIERVGVHDDFFDLGGHSLLFTRLASRIAEAFHVQVPLRVLFDSPTIDLMTLAILQRQVQQSDQDRVRRLLDKVSQLSPERVRELLRRPDAGST